MGKNDRQILNIMCISRVHRKIIFRYFEGNSTKITLKLLFIIIFKAWIARHRVIESRFGRFVILMVVIKYIKHMSKYNFGWRFQKSWFRLDSFKSIEFVRFVSFLRNRITKRELQKERNSPFNDMNYKKGEISPKKRAICKIHVF